MCWRFDVSEENLMNSPGVVNGSVGGGDGESNNDSN